MGSKSASTIPGDNEPIEIKVEPGQHKLRISKDGFDAVTQDIELKTGKIDAHQDTPRTRAAENRRQATGRPR